jgi:hypothetical protein
MALGKQRCSGRLAKAMLALTRSCARRRAPLPHEQREKSRDARHCRLAEMHDDDAYVAVLHAHGGE